MPNRQRDQPAQILRGKFNLQGRLILHANIIRFALFANQFDIDTGRCLRDAQVGLTREDPHSIPNVDIWISAGETVELDVLRLAQ